MPAPLHVTGYRKAVEIIDVLTEGEAEFTELRRRTRLSRRWLARVLRVLAAEGLVTRVGTWDERPAPDTRFALTREGRCLADELADLDVWTALYENYVNGAS
ncbi:winged helix-turn-helix transcriptional regulator [Amycolatopsis sp. NPDC051903]|uniref:winged helix-turn-helix transcriptional regulator n=1 Tax=Amycolatopsis sp. NPDC051903 TaxID=3363936 RepID=UPI0037AD1D56